MKKIVEKHVVTNWAKAIYSINKLNKWVYITPKAQSQLESGIPVYKLVKSLALL